MGNMRLFDRYVLASVLRALAGVALLLFALAFALEWLDQRSGRLGLRDALLLAVLTMPRRLPELLPFVALFGVLLGLGALAATEELTAARAAGTGSSRIVGVALIPVAVLALLALWCGESVMPAAESRLGVLKAEQRGGERDEALRWAHQRGEHGLGGTDVWMAVAAVSADGVLHGVHGFEFEGLELVSAWWVRSLAPVDLSSTGSSPDAVAAPAVRRHAVAAEVLSTRRSGGARGGIEAGRVAQRTLVLPLADGAFTGYLARDAARISLRALGVRVDRLREARTGAAARLLAHYESVRWQRLGQVPATLLLAAIGGGFVFGSLRQMRLGARVALGLLLAIAFKYVGDLLAALVLIYGWPPWTSAAVPLLLLGAATWVSLRRAA